MPTGAVGFEMGLTPKTRSLKRASQDSSGTSLLKSFKLAHSQLIILLTVITITVITITSHLMGQATVAAQEATPVYVDIDTAGVHQPAIDTLKEGGFFDGTECGVQRFCPNDPMTRWVMAVWLIRAHYGTDNIGDTNSTFADVDDLLWWAPHTQRLAELGITQGCDVFPLRYCPQDTVTRAQMASFLVRYLNLDPAPSAGFTDTENNVHATNIDAIAAAGITKGCATQPLRYCPDHPVTRGQMATFLLRAFNTQP